MALIQRADRTAALVLALAVALAPAVALAVAASLAVAAAPPTATAGPRPPPPHWHTAHADARNSDFAPVRGPRRLRPAWVTDLPGLAMLGATVRGDLVFATSSGPGCRLHALSRMDGRTAWCSDALDAAASASSPLLDGGDSVFVADGTGLHAFGPGGARLWTHPLRGVPLSLQWLPDGGIALATHVGTVHVVDPATGSARRDPYPLFDAATQPGAIGSLQACMRGDAACPVANTPAIADTGRMFLTVQAPGADAAAVWAIDGLPSSDPAGPRVAWRRLLSSASASSPALSADGRTLYATDNAGVLHAFDAGDGSRRWAFTIGYASDGSPSVSPDGLVIPAGGRDGRVIALDDRGTHAEPRWRIDEAHLGIATQAGGGLAYLTLRGRAKGDLALAVVDTRDGRVLERHALGSRHFLASGTSIDEAGRVYVTTIRGAVFAFRPAQAAGGATDP